MMADSRETITINGPTVSGQATRITFAGDNVTLTYADGTSQTESMADVTIAFNYVAVFKDAYYDNIATIKTFSGKPVAAQVSRTLTAGQWAPICLPFDMTANDITAAFGSGTRVASFESANETTINFKSVDEMIAGMPYIIFPAQNISSFELDNTAIINMAGGSTVSGENFSFIGTLTTEEPGTNAYYFASGNKIKHLTSGSIKPLRGYLLANASAANPTTFSVDGELTGILTTITGEEFSTSVYTLSGQFVGHSLSGLSKGIYLVDGKKVVVK